ncbi:hypothetical protein HOY82DRAFT_611228 [Tuber indicum]|nr:hypothetical protein HOY82DRAFT_611228 [Tuber indicum]
MEEVAEEGVEEVAQVVSIDMGLMEEKKIAEEKSPRSLRQYMKVEIGRYDVEALGIRPIASPIPKASEELVRKSRVSEV